MNGIQRVWQRLTKSFGTVGSSWGSYTGAGAMDRGKASQSPTMAACRAYVAQGINEAPLIFEKPVKSGDGWEEAEFPPEFAFVLDNLVQNGIVQQTHASRMAGLSWDLLVSKNAVLHILKNKSGKAVSFECIPWSAITPDFGSTTNVLKGYQVSGYGKLTRLDIENVIHIRLGMDETRPCLGDSNESALKEPVRADANASRYMSRVLDAPVPSMVASFNDDTLGMLKDNRDSLKAAILGACSGENAGGVVVPDTGIKIERLSFSPEQMALDKLVKSPQFAICSIFNIPVQALPLFAASESSTYANVAEARKAAAANVLVPIWIAIAQAISERFFPLGEYRFRFNTQNVMALQPDMQIMAERAEKLYRSGVIDRAGAKQMAGIDPLPEDVGHYASLDKMASPIGNNEAQQIRDQIGA